MHSPAGHDPPELVRGVTRGAGGGTGEDEALFVRQQAAGGPYPSESVLTCHKFISLLHRLLHQLL